MAYKIKNWEKFQHYKDKRDGAKLRWIKLYRDLLDDIEWFKLEPASAKGLVMLWLIASDTDGTLPGVESLSFRMRMSEEKLKTLISNLSHWVYNDSTESLQEVYATSTQEKEEEKEEEKDSCASASLSFEEFWKAYPKKKSKGQAEKVW